MPEITPIKNATPNNENKEQILIQKRMSGIFDALNTLNRKIADLQIYLSLRY